MKGFLFAALIAATIGFSNYAQAAACDLRSCSTQITGQDGGKVAWNCDDNGFGYCTVTDICAGCICTLQTSACSGIWTQIDTHVDGRYVCSKWGCGSALANGGTAPQGQERIASNINSTASSEGLGEAFRPDFADVYFGYINLTSTSTVLRSPNTGRATSIKARLDICMGGNDTDAAIATNNATTCYNQYCGTSYNEYCNANSGAVCQDRCECAINGVTDPTCNQL
jgi:hypothetical protein